MARRSRHRVSPETTVEAGRRAEQRALGHLESCGLELLERNFRCRGGEIDLTPPTELQLHPALQTGRLGPYRVQGGTGLDPDPGETGHDPEAGHRVAYILRRRR